MQFIICQTLTNWSQVGKLLMKKKIMLTKSILYERNMLKNMFSIVHHTSTSPLVLGVVRKGSKTFTASSLPSFCKKQYNWKTVEPLFCIHSCRSLCVASRGSNSRFCVKGLLYPISPARCFQFLPCLALRWVAKSSVTEAGKLLNLTLFSDKIE